MLFGGFAALFSIGSRQGREHSSLLSDYRRVDCEVAREALSARLDGEREPVPSVRVDEHLVDCAACRDWFNQAAEQTRGMHRLAHSHPFSAPLRPVEVTPVPPPRRAGMSWCRWGLLCAGLSQLVLAIVQGFGIDVGLAQAHQMSSGGHLLNESTSWSVALGVIMVAAAVRPGAASGLAGVLTVFVGVLSVYVVADALSGAVTVARMLTHLPVVIGAILAILVWRGNSRPRPSPGQSSEEPDIVLPQNASRGRRRGHLWPTDGSAA